MRDKNVFAIIILIIVIIAVAVFFYLRSTGTIENEGAGAGTTTEQVGTGTESTGTGNETAETGEKTFTYAKNGAAFQFDYPEGWAVTEGAPQSREDDFWSNFSQAKGETFVTLESPEDYKSGTNFSNAWLTVGESQQKEAVESCTTMPEQRTPNAEAATTSIGNTTYTKLTMTDAGAGNRYQTTSYRVRVGKSCYAIEYMIHYSPIEFYGTDTDVTEFDKADVESLFDSVVHSFQFGVK